MQISQGEGRILAYGVFSGEYTHIWDLIMINTTIERSPIRWIEPLLYTLHFNPDLLLSLYPNVQTWSLKSFGLEGHSWLYYTDPKCFSIISTWSQYCLLCVNPLNSFIPWDPTQWPTHLGPLGTNFFWLIIWVK